MFLQRLYTCRMRDNLHQKENFLSTVLAELLGDRQVLDLAAAEMGVSLNVGPHTCQPQVRHHDLSATFDIRINLPRSQVLIIECKLDASPDRDQIERYRRLLPDAKVVLIASQAAIDRLPPATWSGVPCCTWQGLARRMIEAEFSSDWSANLSREFILFLREHGHGPLLPIKPEDMDAHARAQAAVSERWGATIQGAVASLLNRDLAQRITDDCWYPDDIGAFWQHDAVHSGFEVRGLGLEVKALHSSVLRWSVLLRRTSKHPEKQTLRDHEFEEIGDNWWRYGLFEGATDAFLDEELGAAVKAARAALRSVGVATGRSTSWPPSAMTVQEFLTLRRDIAEVEQRIASWQAHIGDVLAQEFRNHVSWAEVSKSKKRVTLRGGPQAFHFFGAVDERGWPQVRWETGAIRRNEDHVNALSRARRTGQLPAQLLVDSEGDRCLPLVTADMSTLEASAAVPVLVGAIAKAFRDLPSLRQ